MSGHFSAKYTDEQRDAITSAILDRGASGKRAVELAAAGELTNADGEKIPPFTFSYGYVGTVVDRAKKRRMGTRTAIAQLEPRDAVEQLRRGLVDVCAEEIAQLRKRKVGTRDPERIRQFGRALRELQAIPGPREASKPAPGQHVNGKRDSGATTGLGADLLKASKGSTAQDAQTTQTPTDNSDDAREATHDATQDEDKAQERGPGSLARGVRRPLASSGV